MAGAIGHNRYSYKRGPLPCKSVSAWAKGPDIVLATPQHLTNAQSMPVVHEEQSFIDKLSNPSFLRILVGAGLTWYFLRSMEK